MKNIFKMRRFKFGTLATVITAAFIVAVILINVIAGLLLERFPLTIDLTSDQRFNLTQESIDFVNEITEDVKLTVLAEETEFESSGTYYKQIYEILKAYDTHSSKVSLEFRSLKKNPGIADEYPEETLAEGDIIVSTSKRYKYVASSSLISVSQSTYGTQTYSSQAEQVITSSIMYVTESNVTKAALITGLEGVDVSGLTELLKSNIYDVEEVDIFTGELSDEYDVAILPQPKTDLTTEQAEKLAAYLDNNGEFGKTLLFVAADVTPGDVLKNFLADWGIEMQSGFVYETDSSQVLQSGYIHFTSVADETINNEMSSSGLPIISAYGVPINTLFETSGNRTTTVLLSSNESTIFVPFDAFNEGSDFDFAAQEQKVQNLIVKGSKSRSVDNEAITSNVIAFGSAQMLAQQALTYGGYGNGDFVITAVNQTCGKDTPVKILPVDLSYDTITITESELQMYGIIFIGAIPVIVFVIGIVIFIRRRHL
ncbi:GldG family protein [Phocea massiliensis]|uniref:GldG family protein n=1 Tax=Merdimmobilis hominis TaxID=2897707 RepID=A0A938X7E0_9FIRM|nr:GldG family protein [Merdimmobilis hominis]MBM6921293.1 GldG family protein [Merdimmobilis hominis]